MPKYWVFLTILLLTAIPQSVWAQPVVEIDITGVSSEQEGNVRLFLGIEQQKEDPLLSSGRLRRLHEKAISEIKAALQPYGLYRPRITSSLTEVEAEVWLASYDIDPGPGIPIAEFNLNVIGEMKTDPELQKIIDDYTLQTDTVFNHGTYEAFKSRLSGLAHDRGYMEAAFTQTRVEIDLNVYQTRVYLDMNSGPRYRFGEVSIDQDVLDADFLQKYIPFEKGDPYSLRDLIRLQQSLNDSNYFQIADVSPGEPLADQKEIPVNVVLTPRKRHRYDFGLGYGTDTGARAKFGWRMPRINKRGHRIDSYIEVSEIGYDVRSNYRVPVFNPRTDQLVYTISQEQEEADTNDSTLKTLSVSLNHNRAKWREVLSLSYEEEKFEVASDGGDSTLLIPGISWTRTWGPEFINAVDGVRFSIAVRGADDQFISDTTFVQSVGGIKFISSIDKRNRFLLRGTLGTIETQDFDQLPSSIRFFTGGTSSVRGYSYEELGPVDEDGDVVGGKHLMVGSIEFEHYFNDYWGAAVFLDAGNAFDDFDEDLEQGAGFGMRWKSPVGPVRIDLANAISTDDQDWRIHISIGPDL